MMLRRPSIFLLQMIAVSRVSHDKLYLKVLGSLYFSISSQIYLETAPA